MEERLTARERAGLEDVEQRCERGRAQIQHRRRWLTGDRGQPRLGRLGQEDRGEGCRRDATSSVCDLLERAPDIVRHGASGHRRDQQRLALEGAFAILAPGDRDQRERERARCEREQIHVTLLEGPTVRVDRGERAQPRVSELERGRRDAGRGVDERASS